MDNHNSINNALTQLTGKEFPPSENIPVTITSGMTPEQYKRYSILMNDIEPERLRQTEKHGNPSLPPMQWLPILMEEVGELAKEAVQHEFEGKTGFMEDYRMELVQVIALGFKMLEDFDRRTAPVREIKEIYMAKGRKSWTAEQYQQAIQST